MKKKLYGLSMIVTIFLSTSITALAREYVITDVNATMYSTPEAQLYAEPDLNSQIILTKEAFEDDLPIVVTGVTDNGFFRVDVGVVCYIPENGLTEVSALQTAKNENIVREKQVYDAIIALKGMYPEGMHWTNDNYYGWQGGVFSGGYGCAGFAFLLSDVAFGNKQAVVHKDYNTLRVGDILRVNHDTHSVIILEVKPNSVIVAEGNYNASIHWGREISKAKLQDEYSYIMTRY